MSCGALPIAGPWVDPQVNPWEVQSSLRLLVAKTAGQGAPRGTRTPTARSVARRQSSIRWSVVRLRCSRLQNLVLPARLCPVIRLFAPCLPSRTPSTPQSRCTCAPDLVWHSRARPAAGDDNKLLRPSATPRDGRHAYPRYLRARACTTGPATPSSWRGAGLFGVPERERCLAQGGVGQGLWVVAEVLPAGRVHLLGVQAKRAGKVQQLGEPLGGFGSPAGLRQRLDQPERARQECPFGAGKPVVAG